MATIAKTKQPVRMPRFGHRVDKTDPILRGCVGWWPLNDGAGTKAVDISGKSKHLTAVGNATFTTTAKGTAGDYDGTGDHHQNTSFIVNAFPWTLSAWGYYSGSGTSRDTLLGLGCSSSDVPYCYIFFDNTTGTAAGSTRCSAAGYPFQVVSTSITTGSWYHLVWVQTSQTSGEFFVNGTSVGTDSTNLNSAPTPALNQVSTGALDRTTVINEMLGQVQNARVYNRALSPTEVSRLYSKPWAGLEPLSPFSFFSVPTAGAPLAVFYNHYKNQGII